MNTTAQPESEVDNIIAELNSFRETFDFTPFDLARLKKKAQHIKENVDLPAGFAIMGMIANLEHDIEASRSYFKRAIQQSGGSPYAMANYAITLMDNNFQKESYKYALKAYEKAPDDLSCLDILISVTCRMGNKDEFEKYTTLWHRKTKEAHLLTIRPLKTILQIRTKNPEQYNGFVKAHPELTDIQEQCNPELMHVFDAPLHIDYEIIPDADSGADKLIGWIQWHGDTDEGLKKYEQFKEWITENNLTTGIITFGIETDENLVSDHIRNLVEKGRVPEARNVLPVVRYKGSERLNHWKKVLALPKATVKKSATGNDNRKNALWFRENAHKYKGKWIALKDGVLLGSHKSRIELHQNLKQAGNLSGSLFSKIRD